ncbi:VUT family protein [Ferruginibacter sp.]
MTDIINEYYGMKGVRFLSWLTAILIAFAFVIFYGAMQLTPAIFSLQVNKAAVCRIWKRRIIVCWDRVGSLLLHH